MPFLLWMWFVIAVGTFAGYEVYKANENDLAPAEVPEPPLTPCEELRAQGFWLTDPCEEP